MSQFAFAQIRIAWERSIAREALRLAALHSFASFNRVKPRGVSHLTFHAIPESQAELFAAFLDRLADHGPIISTSDALRREREGRTDPAFTISFDDGYKSTFTVAGGILHERGLPSIIFVSSGFIGLSEANLLQFTRERLHWPRVRAPMSEDDLAQCWERGIEIGSHGVSHRSFATMLGGEARTELAESKSNLEQMTGRPVRYFAWPFGRLSDFPIALIPVALAIGYEGLFSGVSRAGAPLPEYVYPRRTIEMSWGLRVCTYLALRG